MNGRIKNNANHITGIADKSYFPALGMQTTEHKILQVVKTGIDGTGQGFVLPVLVMPPPGSWATATSNVAQQNQPALLDKLS